MDAVPLADLWLAILLSGVGVFIASSLVHMVIGWHKSDYGKLPGEDAIRDVMREQGVKPGHYLFPCPDNYSEMQTPEMQAKYEQGPVGFMTLMPPGPWTMGKSLGIWFAYSIGISLCVGYLLTLALPAGAEYSAVFRIAATAGVMAYALPAIVDSIWKGIRWGITLRFIGDGIIYALVTAGVFGWQWPAAA